ncbi:MAG TPA: gliding motility-associated C-terminal domain-containing protein [Puia sp.]|nr:gliding motility-associated C-terminal domain-containing protein [Puia sp.]
MKSLLPVLCCFIYSCALAQSQSCPLNNNFSSGTLTHWWAYTGNNAGGNGPGAIRATYDSNTLAPSGTLGNSIIYEYQLPSVPGIQVLSTSTTDYYGGFATIPKINGYQYTNSVLLGSTSITRSNNSGVQGGYIRGISYRINVPTSAVSQPYTMTYAYAMVLENGTHNSSQQPLFSATLTTHDSVISCASPKYFLPTLNNADNRGTGAVLDSALAKSQGIFPSIHPSPNSNPNSSSPNAEHLYDVWAKGWSEVTFDLSPYRGQQVTLTFEADNCVPGGHFAYAYVALRNNCDGLMISGPSVACIGGTLTYSIPALTGATYQWNIPGDWTVVSGADSNILQVKVGTNPGKISALEVNSCANLKDTINVTTTPPTIAGDLSDNSEVCAGTNSTTLTLANYRGTILNWLSSADGVNYTALPATTPPFYQATNLVATTVYKALVQNGASCAIDTSTAVTITVDPKSVGGQLAPSGMVFCMGQNKDALLTLSGQTGGVQNWQSSPDGINWVDFTPPNPNPLYSVLGITQSTQYRVLVKSGVCPVDTSAISDVTVVSALFPQAAIRPTDTTICYGATAQLSGSISIGTDYTWSNTANLSNPGDGNISSLPYSFQTGASPPATTNYVLRVENAGCPNPLLDTFHVQVIPPIIVNAGNDTAVVINQPLQLHATSSDSTANFFTWTPPTGLDNPNISNPVAILGSTIDSIRYLVKATSEVGCFGVATILVRVFKTLPDIFVPNAFTPGKGSNGVFRPIPVGISTLQYFKVYNRWGQLVYGTSAMGQGWDGRLNGKLQDVGTYVWMAQGTSYTGKTIFRKGTMVLLR